ncbi:hypothetical protein CFI00_20575 [Nocardioides sp. S5]|uniref:oligosaccharide flippase family protein n=1 Tax=Nocardioides sp. S5 TaxID=2017486 RepID=UPI001A905CAE|nr:oligosaccharide flippase family protein [Nocardioides sp. S5]QSR32850.1 hypothetical protein CFI00_20575 [Nocardioides sp. S5]
MTLIEEQPSVVRATAWSTSGAVARMILNLAGMVILARLVAPESFGLFAVSSSLVLIVAYLSEIGSSWALVQHKAIRAEHVGSALILALGAAAALSSTLAITAGGVARFMQMPELQEAILAMCLIIPVQAASGVPRALLRRAMNFGRLVRVDLVAAGTGLVCGLTHALLAPSYWSLVVQAIVYQLVLAGGLWTKSARSAVGRPSRRGCSDLFAFARGQTLHEAMMLVSKNLDTFLIARTLGAGPLGLYSRAFALIFSPLGQVYTAVGSVAFSAMSRHQNERSQIRAVHRRFLIACIAGFSVPLMVVSSFSGELVAVVLGEPWSGAAPLLGVLAVAAAFQVIYANMLWVLQATAQLQAQIRAGALLTAVNVGGFVVATYTQQLIHFGIAYIGGAVAALIYVLRALLRTNGLPFRFYAGAIGLTLISWPVGQLLHAALTSLYDSPLAVIAGLLGLAVLAIVLAAASLRSHVNIFLAQLRPKEG